MRKRGNGEGSIYEVPGRGWRGAVMLGRKLDGKPNRKVASGDTRAEVSRKLNKLIEDHRKGVVVAPAKLTVATCLNNWLRDTIRRGEVLALRWSDIDFEDGWIGINASIVRVRVKRLKEQPATRFSGAGSRLAPLKTGSKARRSLEMSAFVRSALEEQQRQQAQRERAGDKWREQGFVFTSECGDHWHPDTATAAFAELRTLADIPATTRLHDLRHSLASAMLRSKVHPKVVQEQLGHSRVQITLDKYSHLIPGVKTEVGDAMEAFIAEGKRALHKTRVATSVATKPGLALVAKRA